MFRLYSFLSFTRKTFLKTCCVSQNRNCPLSQLVEIGKFEKPRAQRYQSGQLFIHKLFGYRGLIVIPWTGLVFDRDMSENPDDPNYEIMFMGGREVKYYTKNYYQAFVDSRDRPFCKPEKQISIPFTLAANTCAKLLHCSPVLDYVAHEDILPYKPTQQTPIKHEMVGEFFVYRPAHHICFEPRDVLKPSLMRDVAQMKIDVHKETTENIRIIAIPIYIGYNRLENLMIHSWRYWIQIENLTGVPVKLLSQSWKIFSLSGLMEEICIPGVMGEEVTIDNSMPVYQYSSQINLLAPFGHMVGSFRMEKQDFSKLTCRVPHIMLESRRGPEEMLF